MRVVILRYNILSNVEMGYEYYMNDPRFWRGVIDVLDASWEATKKRFAKYNKLNEDIMEEKKTRKMTKAEAFEYFKGKRVACDECDTKDIQRKLFEVGVKWRGGSTNATDDRGNFLFVDLKGCLTHCNSREWFDRHEYEEISADDILSIEIVEEKEETENISIELEKWIGVVRDKFCCNGWSFVISASNFPRLRET